MSRLIPYVESEGMWSFPDVVIMGIYQQMKTLGLDKVVFAGDTIKTPGEWMMFVKNKRNVVHIVGNEKDVEHIGWLNSFGCNYAFGHFCFFPSTWGGNTVDIGKMVLDYWFNDLKTDEFRLDVILGQIPAHNERAIEYTKKIGFVSMGIVPGIKYKVTDENTGAYFCYIRRQ